MSQEKTKVYIYTRVSTTMQIDGYSLDANRRLFAGCPESPDESIR